MATGRGGNKIKTRLGFLLYGDYGTWKSSFCLESMKLVNEEGRPFRVLFIDPENGGVDTYLDKTERENCRKTAGNDITFCDIETAAHIAESISGVF